MKNRKTIKRRWIIAIIILMVLLVAAAAVYLWQQENIKAAANARKYTEAELKQQLADSRESIQTAIEQNPGITVRDLTEEERASLRKGELSADQLVRILTQPAKLSDGVPEQTSPAEGSPAQSEARPDGSPAESAGPAQPASPVPASPAPTVPPHEPTQQELYEQQLSELVARVYVLREQYTAILDGMVAQAKAEYSAMPEKDRTKSKLASWASGYASRASELEAQCDAEMNAIIAEMKRLVDANNGDRGFVNTVAYAYAQEKSIKKSIYIQEFDKRGIMK